MLAFIDPESRIPAKHPLRTIKRFADAALAELAPQFDALYAADGTGRPSIPPERLLEGELAGWVDLGSCPPRPPGRSGLARIGHPAPQVTGSLRDARSS